MNAPAPHIPPCARTSRVAVAPTKFSRGVEAPGFKGLTYDWRAAPESADNTREVRPVYDVMTLGEALSARYRTDAHLVTYYVVDPDGRPLAKQPRVNKGGLSWLLSQRYRVEHDVIMVDVDNPLHGEWTDGLRARFDELWATARPLRTVGVYFTAHGYRLIQPLDEPIHAGEDSLERYLAAWIEELADHGVKADTSCVDWTRVFRLPHVRRNRTQADSERVDLSRLTPRAISPKPGAVPRGRHVAGRASHGGTPR